MKIILKKDVAKVGLRGEVKDVNPGYARNYLFPKNLAEAATKSNLDQLKRVQEMKNRLVEEQGKKAKLWAKSLSGKTFEMNVEVGDKGQLFEAIDASKIAQLLTENGFSVEDTQILIDKPIKEVGEFSLDVRLTPEVLAKTKIKINSAH